jgi:hypothetical protein
MVKTSTKLESFAFDVLANMGQAPGSQPVNNLADLINDVRKLEAVADYALALLKLPGNASTFAHAEAIAHIGIALNSAGYLEPK